MSIDRVASCTLTLIEHGGDGTGQVAPGGKAPDTDLLRINIPLLGMMPHPERLSDPALGGNDGRVLFDHLVAALG